MYRKLIKTAKLLLAFVVIVIIYNCMAVSVSAANRVIKVKNGISGEVRIREDDFITFVPQLKNKKKKQSYFYYSPENGKNLFQFGNGKYWASKKGLATVMITGLDNQGNLNFIADYKVIIEKSRRIKKDIANNKNINGNQEENNTSSGNLTNGNNIDIPTQSAIQKNLADVTGVTLSQSKLVAKRTKIGAFDNEVTTFKIDINSKIELNETNNADISIVSSNSNMKVAAYLEKNVLTIDVYNTGVSTLTVDINGKKFNLDVNIIDNEISSTSVVIAEGGSHQLKIRGEGEGVIEWNSANSDIAEVDTSGKVVGKNKGNTLITAKVNGKTFGCVVSVTSEIRKNVVEWARAYSLKSKYSQSKRMEEGYYDCSSLAWRAYRKFGFNIMNTNYAPTAAAMGQFYDQKKQIVEGGISDANINKMAFEPGDLFFMEGPVNNGRYRNVYHVEIISGYTFKGFDKSGKPLIGIEFANRNQNDFRGFVGKP
nr:Ig-like domain-containing protein [uncultured Catonella sp.]